MANLPEKIKERDRALGKHCAYETDVRSQKQNVEIYEANVKRAGTQLEWARAGGTQIEQKQAEYDQAVNDLAHAKLVLELCEKNFEKAKNELMVIENEFKEVWRTKQ